MLLEEDPLYPNWDQDATAVEERYREQDPAVVSVQLHDAANALADAFDTVEGDQWLRRGRRGDGARFSIAGFSRYLLHDPVHHLYDVTEDWGSRDPQDPPTRRPLSPAAVAPIRARGERSRGRSFAALRPGTRS